MLQSIKSFVKFKMKSLVLELQKESLDESVSLKSLARKAMAISLKLGLDDTWAQSELYGYTKQDPPSYREVGGQLVAKVPLRGYVPVELPGNLSAEMRTFTLRQPIAELEAVLGFHDNYAYITLGQELQVSFRNVFKNQFVYSFQVPLSQIKSLLDAIRSQILNLTLRLEKEGILGDGMSFNHNEEEKAKNMIINVHGNFQGILGDVSQSDVTQTFTNGIQGDLGALVEALKLHQVADTDITDLKTAITVDGEVVTKADDYGPEVTSWYKRMLSKAIDGSWQVSIATAGNILSTVLNGFYLAN